jgi:polyisoprenoid-binding protein YceI
MIGRWSILSLALSIASVSAANNEGKPIDTDRSSLLIHVGKAGLFSAAGHEHWVNAPIPSTVDDTGAAPAVQFIVAAAKLTVMNDKQLDPARLSEVQSNMQNKVLDSSKYPGIIFHSTHVQREGDAVWNVNGDLTLHGVTRPVMVAVRVEKDAYIGITTIKTDFGIRPVQAGGGAVKVKNELEIRFKLYVTSSRKDPCL